MRSHRFIGFPALILLCVCTVWSSLAQAAAIDLPEIIFDEYEYDGSPWTLGWKFTVNEPATVHALGVYDDSIQDGLVNSAQVGLWLAAGGDPIAQTIIPTGTAAPLDGHFRFAPITPTLLAPGTEYIVGSYLDGELATTYFGGNGVVDPRVTVIDGRFTSTEETGFGFPDITDGISQGSAFLGANFQLTPVPLPAAAWLFASGAAGLGMFMRKRRSHHA